MAEALYRKYRPQVFEDMVGQEHIERTLKNAIDQDKVSHAYLFCGPRGTGKTTTARLLAKALLCEKGPTSSPDGTCRDCEEVAEGTHPDVYELDAASRTGVENVREEIIGRVNFAPTRGKKKIYIIDEVHMLSTAAFNALLKTLEEPPSHVVFVLCTTDPQKVPATIHSRCQRFDFHRLGTDEIVSRLGAVCMGEDVEFEGDALAIIAHRADGGMRNALTSLEQLIAFGNGTVTVQGAEDLLGSLDSSDMAEIVRAVGRRDVAACFNWTANYVESGADLAQFARDLAQRIRNMYVMTLAGADVALEVPDAERREIAEELTLFGPDRLARMLALLGDLISELRTAGNPRLCFEIALTRMVRPDSDLTLEALAERVEALEAGKSAVATYVPEGGPAMSTPAAAVSDAPMSNPARPQHPSAPMAASGAAPVPAMGRGAAPAPAVAPNAPSAFSVGAGGATAPAARQGSAGKSAPGGFVQAPVQMGSASAPVPFPVQSPAQPEPARVAAAPAPASQAQQDSAVAGQVPLVSGRETASAPAPAMDAPAEGGQASSALAAIVTNPAALQRVWRSVVAAVKKERVSYGVLFVNVRARAEADGSGVVVEFPADNPFAFNMAQKPDVLEVMSQAFDRVAGTHVPFRCAQAQAAPAAVAPSAAVPISQAPSSAGVAVPPSMVAGQSGSAVPQTEAGRATSPASAPTGARPAGSSAPAPAAPMTPQPTVPAASATPQAAAPAAPQAAALATPQAAAPAAPQAAALATPQAAPPTPPQSAAPEPAAQPAPAAPQGAASTPAAPQAALSASADSGVRPQAAPAPSAQPAPVPSAPQAPAAGAADPYDEVPLDVYDSMAPSYEDDYGYGEPSPMAAPMASGEPVAPVESRGPEQAPTANADDLSKMISGSMGVDVFFEEVDE